MAAEFSNNNFEGKDIEQALAGWRDSANASAERPAWFWSRQHARVMSKISTQRGPLPKLAWASLAATVAIAVALIIPARPDKTVQQSPLQSGHESQISDHDLMLAIERSMNAGVPSSLAPASLLAEEMNQALETQVQSQKAKEIHYEN